MGEEWGGNGESGETLVDIAGSSFSGGTTIGASPGIRSRGGVCRLSSVEMRDVSRRHRASTP